MAEPTTTAPVLDSTDASAQHASVPTRPPIVQQRSTVGVCGHVSAAASTSSSSAATRELRSYRHRARMR